MVLTLATATALVQWIGPDQLRTAVTRMEPTWLVVAVGLEVAALACLSRVYVAVVRGMDGDLTNGESARIALGAFSLSQLLPAGGAVGGVYAARRLARTFDPVRAATAIATFGVISLTTLGLLVGTGTTAAALVSGVGAGVAIATMTGTMALALAAFVVGRALGDPVRRARLVGRLARLARRDDATRRAWTDAAARQGDVLAHPTRLLPAVGWSVLNWSLDIAVLAAITAAVGLDLSPVAIIATYGVANLANMVPLTPGGIGLVEAGITGTLVAMGVDAGSAALVALGFRVVGDLLPVAIAVPVVLTGWADRTAASGLGDVTLPESGRGGELPVGR